jgi:hypothetical protein
MGALDKLNLVEGLRKGWGVISDELPKWHKANESEMIEVPDESRDSVMFSGGAPYRKPTKLEQNEYTLGRGAVDTALAVAPFNKPTMALGALAYGADAEAKGEGTVGKVGKAVGKLAGRSAVEAAPAASVAKITGKKSLREELAQAVDDAAEDTKKMSMSEKLKEARDQAKDMEQKAKRMAEETPPEGQQNEADRMFGNKAKQEAERAVAHLKGLEAENRRAKAIKAGKNVRAEKAVEDVPADSRQAVDPRKYRKMYNESGMDSVIADAEAGGHIRPAYGGGFVGFPRHIKTREQINQLRGQLDNELGQSANALSEAEAAVGNIDRVGTWYPRAKSFNYEINEPYQLPTWLNSGAVHSAGASPEIELAFNLKHNNPRSLGRRDMAYRGNPMRTLDNWEFGNWSAEPTKATGLHEPTPTIPLANKVGEYRIKNDPWHPDDGSPFGVNDFRMGQTFTYTDANGAPWHAGVSDTMHPVMDAETALLGKRASEKNLGGIKNWTGELVQEIPWVGGKAQDIYYRGIKGGKGGKFATPDGKHRALVEANNTAGDYAPKHAFTVNVDQTPSANVGHRADVLEMTPAQQAEYIKQGNWARTNQEGAIPGVSEDGAQMSSLGGRRDAMVAGLRMRQPEVVPSVSASGTPTHQASPLVDFRTVPEKKNRMPGDATIYNQMSLPTKDALEATEGLRGLIDARGSVSGNLPVTVPARTGKSGYVMDTRDLRKDRALAQGQQFSPEELAQIDEMGSRFGLRVEPTRRGLSLINDGKAQSAKVRSAFMRELENRFPSAKVEQSANEGFNFQTLGPEQNTGQYTKAALERFAAAEPEVAQGLGESDEIRRKIQQKIMRDEGHPMTRQDIQETRRFFADKDWPRAVEMMRKGMSAAAAVAALGGSLEAMAQDK